MWLMPPAIVLYREPSSVRYRLRKTFTSGNYEFIVTGDNGFRLSLDGGATWVINSFVDLAPRTLYYSAALDGTYDMVLDFFEVLEATGSHLQCKQVAAPQEILLFMVPIINGSDMFMMVRYECL